MIYYLFVVLLYVFGWLDGVVDVVLFMIVLFIVLFLYVVFGEMVLKNLVFLVFDCVVLFFVFLLVWVLKVFMLVIWVFNVVVNGVLKLFCVELKNEVVFMFIFDEVVIIVS